MKRLIKKNFYPLFLCAITIIIASSNYEPGTILSGWDTLHPEFNFPEYFKRIIFGVWQQHQGLGSIATQSHPSELPRLIVYYLMSFFLPLTFLRYGYFFLMLILGPLGVFYFLKEVLFKNNGRKGEIFSFLGSLFYLLNLVTVQQFFVPFEMFATHYASIGWLFLFAFKFLTNGKNKYLLLFTMVTVLSSSIGHTATLWYSYFAGILIFLVSANILTKNKGLFKRSALIALISIFLNLFWILPDLYFAIYHAGLISQSKIHALFTQEAFAQNASFGRIEDLGIFRNFLFNWGIYSGNGRFSMLLGEWINHLKNPFVIGIGYLFFIIAVLGIFSAIKNKNKTQLSFLSIFILSVFFWMNINPPFGWLFKFFQDYIPLFKEALRFPFTKFSILLIFSTSIYFSIGLFYLDTLSQKIKKNKLFSEASLLFVTLLLFIYMFPAFQGYLISPYMKVVIPKEYFDMFSWFKQQDGNGRVATLPINSFWGWNYYQWQNSPKNQGASYQGAGFTWFGIKQPILEREFDRWNPLNEQYYREMSQAVYSKDSRLFNQVIKKYDIKYVFIDKNVISPESYFNPQILFTSEIEELIKKAKIKEVKSFGDKLTVYIIEEEVKPVYILNSPPSVSPNPSAYYKDFAYEKYSDYITYADKNEIYYPFRNIIDNQNHFLPKVSTNPNGLSFDLSAKDSTFSVPAINESDDFISAEVFLQKTGNELDILIYPTLPLEDLRLNPAPLVIKTQLPKTDNFVITINKDNNFLISSLPNNAPYSIGKVLLSSRKENPVSIYLSSDKEQIAPDFSQPIYSLYICGEGEKRPVFGVTGTAQNNFTLFSKNTQLCMLTPLDFISQELTSSTTDSDSLINISYQYKGTTKPSLCIASVKDSNCQYYSSKNINFRNEAGSKISQYFSFNPKDLDKLAMRIFLDSRGQDKIEQSFADVNLTITKPFFSVTIRPELIEQALSGISQKIGNKYKIRANFLGAEQFSQDITKLPKTDGDCPTANPRGPNPASREVLKETANFVRYSSRDGSFCDHFSYLGLPKNQAYLITVVSRNITGLPLRVCITNNISKRCDLYTHLTTSSSFKEETFLLPGMGENQSFDININNFAIKRIPSVNDIKSIAVVPISYTWLSNLSEGSTTRKSSRSEINQIEHPNPSLYLVKTGKINKNNVIVLSQAFDMGWKAYEVDNFGVLNKLFPFLFGSKIKNHLIVNSWENGWSLEQNKNESSIIIVYLPQYLEYMGIFLLLFVAPLLFLRRLV